MNSTDRGYNVKRLALTISGGMDVLIGALLLMIGLGILHVHLADYGIPGWLALLVGALLFISGAAVAAHNLSRLGE